MDWSKVSNKLEASLWHEQLAKWILSEWMQFSEFLRLPKIDFLGDSSRVMSLWFTIKMVEYCAKKASLDLDFPKWWKTRLENSKFIMQIMTWKDCLQTDTYSGGGRSQLVNKASVFVTACVLIESFTTSISNLKQRSCVFFFLLFDRNKPIAGPKPVLRVLYDVMGHCKYRVWENLCLPKDFEDTETKSQHAFYFLFLRLHRPYLSYRSYRRPVHRMYGGVGDNSLPQDSL